jgi:hypothetical protein
MVKAEDTDESASSNTSVSSNLPTMAPVDVPERGRGDGRGRSWGSGSRSRRKFEKKSCLKDIDHLHTLFSYITIILSSNL